MAQETIPVDQQKRIPARFHSIALECAEFLKVHIMKKNVILERDFIKFMPLFNREQLKKLNGDDKTRLAKEFSITFSQRDPVYVITPELDPENGVVYYEDGQKHKVRHVIHPGLRELATLNVLGKDAGTLEVCLVNNAHPDNPFDKRGEFYAKQIGKAWLEFANTKEMEAEQDEQFRSIQDSINSEKPATPASPGERQVVKDDRPSNPSGIDADWEE